MKKLLFVLAAGIAAMCARGAIDLRSALLSGGLSDAETTALLKAGVSGGGYADDYVPQNLVDGKIGAEVGTGKGRWLGRIVSGSTDTNETAYVQFSIPARLAKNGCRIIGYTLHRLHHSGANYLVRAPTEWQLLGVTANGETVLIHEKTSADGIVWIDGESDEAMTKHFSVDDSREFVKLIWIPTSSECLTTQQWNVGLNEFEIFIEGKDPIPGLNLAQWMKANGYDVDEYVTGGTAGVHYRDDEVNHNVPSRVFDALVHSDGPQSFWFGRIDTTDETKNSFISVRVPEELQGGVRPTGYRLWRCNPVTNVADIASAPVDWEFYGIAPNGATNLLSQVSGMNWDAYAGMSVLHFGQAKLDNPDGGKFSEFLWIPRKSGEGYMDRADFQVALSEIEIFFDQNELPAGRSLADEIRDSGLAVADFVGGHGTMPAANYQTFEHAYAFDGVTSTKNYASSRWLAFMTDDDETTARLEISVPHQLYPHGVSLSYYRVHRLSCPAASTLARAPLTWDMFGVTKSGSTNLISRVDESAEIVWNRVPYYESALEVIGYGTDVQGVDPQYIEVSELNGVKDENYVKFIWIPRSSNHVDVGIHELEIFVGEVFQRGTLLIVR